VGANREQKAGVGTCVTQRIQDQHAACHVQAEPSAVFWHGEALDAETPAAKPTLLPKDSVAIAIAQVRGG